LQLRGQLQSGPSEIAKAAQSISELSELWQPEDELSGIEVIEQDQRLLVKHLNHVKGVQRLSYYLPSKH
jgi:hypothetical protein